LKLAKFSLTLTNNNNNNNNIIIIIIIIIIKSYTGYSIENTMKTHTIKTHVKIKTHG